MHQLTELKASDASVSARLPSSLAPQHYEVELATRLEPPWDIQGQVTITMMVTQPTRNVSLNMRDIITYNHTAHVIYSFKIIFRFLIRV